MKVNKAIMIFIFGIIVSCNSANSGNIAPVEQKNLVQSTLIIKESENSSQDEGKQSDDIELKIPEKDTETLIHDQLLFFGMGGDYDNNEGDCDSCSITNQSYRGYIELTGFNPNQELELTIYQYMDTGCTEAVAEYLFSENVMVNQAGNLKIVTENNNSKDIFVYTAKDINSGKVEWKWHLPLSDIFIGQEIRVNYTTGEPLRIRTEPYIEKSTYIASLEEGVHMTVIDGPVCPSENEYKWWYVKSGNYSGWIAEGSYGDKFIEVIQ